MTGIFASSASSAQQDIISVWVNGKTIGRVNVREEPYILPVHKLQLKNTRSVMVIYKQANRPAVYKRSIEFTNHEDSMLYHVVESKTKPGSFNINIPTARKIIAKEKTVKVYFLEDPSNDRMALPSRRKLLVELHLL